MQNMVALFDESGTPSIRDDKRTDWFIGVAVAYEQSDDLAIFSTSEADFGLARPKPLKNDRITISRSVRIAEILCELPVRIYLSSVNTADPTYRETIVAYEHFGNKIRTSRGAKERPIAQIIHSHVVDHCLFNAITGHFEAHGNDAAFAVFIDNWSIPNEDIDVYLKDRSLSLREKISWLCEKCAGGRLLSVKPIELLIHDDNRKRFVDIVASILSRAYLKTNNPRYSSAAVDTLQNCGRLHCNDATEYSIAIMQQVMGKPVS